MFLYFRHVAGVFKNDGPYDMFVNIRQVQELNDHSVRV